MLLDGADTSTMTRTGNRVDEWRDKLGSGNKVETSSLGTGSNPNYNSTLFSNVGGVRFVSNVLETAAAFTTMNWANGWTILMAGQHRTKTTYHGMSDGGTYTIFGASKSDRFGAQESWATKEQIPFQTSCVMGSMYTVATITPPVAAALKYIRNGEIYDVQSGTPGVGTGAFGKLQIGSRIGTGVMALDVRAIAIYNRELTTSEVQSMCFALVMDQTVRLGQLILLFVLRPSHTQHTLTPALWGRRRIAAIRQRPHLLTPTTTRRLQRRSVYALCGWARKILNLDFILLR
jgi:hypothetical protein